MGQEPKTNTDVEDLCDSLEKIPYPTFSQNQLPKFEIQLTSHYLEPIPNAGAVLKQSLSMDVNFISFRHLSSS